MTSNFRIVKSLEWCTKLPTKDCSRKSPVFLATGNECFFKFALENVYSFFVGFRFTAKLYIEFKCTHTEFKPCNGTLQIGFVKEEKLILASEKFSVTEPSKTLMWECNMAELQPKLPTDYLGGNWIKFIFCFDTIDEPLLKMNEVVENTSSELLDSKFSLERLSQDYSKMLKDGLDSDVEIKCADHTWQAHKIVLSTRSKVLQTMLNSDMIEGRTKVITFQDMDVPTVQHFLNYIYSGKLPEMNVEIAKQFYELGDKYAVECLKDICANYLVNKLTLDNACENLILADQHNDPNFKESVIQFMIEEKSFMDNDLWRNFSQSNSLIAIEVYDRFIRRHISNEI